MGAEIFDRKGNAAALGAEIFDRKGNAAALSVKISDRREGKFSSLARGRGAAEILVVFQGR